MQKPYSVMLDLYSAATKATDIVYYRGDKNVYPLEARLLKRGAPYRVPDGAEAFLNLRLPGGITDKGRMTVTDAAEGLLQYDVLGGALDALGTVTASVEVQTATERLTWPSFTFTVRASLDDQGAEPPKPYAEWTRDISAEQIEQNARLTALEEGGGSGGVAKAYVDEQDAATLESAKTYADTRPSIPEAPTDGKTYGRKDTAWAEITGGADDPIGAITFPPVFFAAQGKPLEIYYDSILSVLPEGYSALIAGKGVGNTYGRKFTLAADLDPGTYSITLRIYNRQRTEVKAVGSSVVVYRQPTSPGAQNMLFIGDSLTALGANMMKCMEEYCAEDFGANLFTFVGTRGTAPYNNEGVGGTTIVSFATSSTTGSVPNPFWDTAENRLSFAYYERENDIRPDIACIQLGINDIVSAERSATETVAAMETFVHQLRADWPETIIYIVAPAQCAGQDALGNHWKKGFKPLSVMDKSMYEYAAAIYASFSDTPMVHIVPNYFAFDRAYNYTTTEASANPFVSETVISGDDALHPKAEAYRQIGANIYHTWMSAPHSNRGPVTLTNLITNGDFSDGTAGWSTNGAAIATLSANGDGSVSGALVTDTSRASWYIQRSFGANRIPADHLLYARALCQQTMFVDGEAAPTRWHQAAVQQGFSNPASTIGLAIKERPDTFVALSGIKPSAAAGETVTTYWRMWFSIQGSANVIGTTFRVGNFIVVDLTEAYGAGGEPDQAWCDANIPFFNGTITL